MNDFDLGFKKRELLNMNRTYIQSQIGDKKLLKTLHKQINM